MSLAAPRPVRDEVATRIRWREWIVFAIVAHCVYAPSGVAQQTTKGEATPGARSSQARARLHSLAADINSIIGDYAFVDASWGVSVVSCQSGEILYEHDANRNRQYASNIKLVTTSAALALLGSDYRFSTEIYIAGLIADGTTENDLVIRPMGDPTISPSFGVDPRGVLGEWGGVLDSLGVRKVRNVVVDASWYEDTPYGPGWAWDDEAYGFNARVSAAAIYDNSVEVRIEPGEVAGAPVRIHLVPPTAYVSLQVTAVTGTTIGMGTIDVRRERGSDIITVSGSIALGAEPYVENISVDDPPIYLGTLVSEELARRNIAVKGGVVDAADLRRPLPYSSMRRIHVHRSQPLRRIVTAINKQSLNLAAELLVREIGQRECGAGETAAGIDAVRRWHGTTGVDPERIRIVDGSGLSRLNMLAPSDVTRILRASWMAPWWADFRASLSVAGVDGTLANRMTGSLAAGNAIGKTGFLNGIRALSGYVRTRDGEWLAFSIVANNYSVPTGVVNTAQDMIVMRLASFARKA